VCDEHDSNVSRVIRVLACAVSVPGVLGFARPWNKHWRSGLVLCVRLALREARDASGRAPDPRARAFPVLAGSGRMPGSARRVRCPDAAPNSPAARVRADRSAGTRRWTCGCQTVDLIEWHRLWRPCVERARPLADVQLGTDPECLTSPCQGRSDHWASYAIGSPRHTPWERVSWAGGRCRFNLEAVGKKHRTCNAHIVVPWHSGRRAGRRTELAPYDARRPRFLGSGWRSRVTMGHISFRCSMVRVVLSLVGLSLACRAGPRTGIPGRRFQSGCRLTTLLLAGWLAGDVGRIRMDAAAAAAAAAGEWRSVDGGSRCGVCGPRLERL